MNKKTINSVFFRYILLVVLGIPNLFIFYFILTPLTFYPSYFFIKLIYGAQIIAENTIFFKGYSAIIIPACIAGSAYYLLTILNLTTPLNFKTRIKSLIFLILSFLILNIIRIVFFSALFVNKGYDYFNVTHIATWYFGSTILVILIWFANVFIFKIKSIPVYSDFKNLSNSLLNKHSKKYMEKK
ncbi:MAG: pacearchaeosortase [Candidatus Pacearchaeota archaeon]|nr:pacearchaeosortase [Candidatus Pacearchaeota archaeon]